MAWSKVAEVTQGMSVAKRSSQFVEYIRIYAMSPSSMPMECSGACQRSRAHLEYWFQLKRWASKFGEGHHDLSRK